MTCTQPTRERPSIHWGTISVPTQKASPHILHQLLMGSGFVIISWWDVGFLCIFLPRYDSLYQLAFPQLSWTWDVLTDPISREALPFQDIAAANEEHPRTNEKAWTYCMPPYQLFLWILPDLCGCFTVSNSWYHTSLKRNSISLCYSPFSCLTIKMALTELCLNCLAVNMRFETACCHAAVTQHSGHILSMKQSGRHVCIVIFLFQQLVCLLYSLHTLEGHKNNSLWYKTVE